MREELRKWDGLALLMALLWGHAAYWLLTPHPDASGLRRAAVLLQAVVAMAVFLWAMRRRIRLTRIASGTKAPETDGERSD